MCWEIGGLHYNCHYIDASLVSAAPYELGRTCDALWLEINRLHVELSLDASVVATIIIQVIKNIS